MNPDELFSRWHFMDLGFGSYPLTARLVVENLTAEEI